MKTYGALTLIMLTACSLHASESSSAAAPAVMVSSVIRTTQVKQPNAIDYAHALLKKGTITRAERDKAISLLEAAMPLTLIEESRRTPIKLNEEYKAVNAQAKKSLDVDSYCNDTLKKLLSYRDEFKSEFEATQQKLIKLNAQNGHTTSTRTSTLLKVLELTQKMLLHKEPTIKSDDEDGKAIKALLYQLSVASELPKNGAYGSNDDDGSEDNDFVEIERLADEKFEEAKNVELDRMRCIVAKYQQLCAVIGVMVPLSETLKKEADHHHAKALRVNVDIDNARARYEEAQQVVTTNTELIAQLHKKPLS